MADQYASLFLLGETDMHPQSFVRVGCALVMTLACSIALADELQVERFGVYVRVADLERAHAFYERVLGKKPYVTNDRLVGFDVQVRYWPCFWGVTTSTLQGGAT